MPIIIDADTSTYAWSATLRLSERLSVTPMTPPILSSRNGAACRWRHSTGICRLPHPRSTSHFSARRDGNVAAGCRRDFRPVSTSVRATCT